MLFLHSANIVWTLFLLFQGSADGFQGTLMKPIWFIFVVIHDKDDQQLPSFWMMGSKVFSITLILGSTTLVIILVAEKAEKMEKEQAITS